MHFDVPRTFGQDSSYRMIPRYVVARVGCLNTRRPLSAFAWSELKRAINKLEEEFSK